MMGLQKNKDVRLVCRFVEKTLGCADITMIATPKHETDAGRIFFNFVKQSDTLRLDMNALKSQPRWEIAARYYML